MSVPVNLSWSPQADGRFRVRSAWWELLWHPVRGLTEVAFGPTDRGREADEARPTASGGNLDQGRPTTAGQITDRTGATASACPTLTASDSESASLPHAQRWKAPAILGLAGLHCRGHAWNVADWPPDEVVIQENRITVSWLTRPGRPVEVHARWILEGCRFWLEVSLLTPTRLEALALETRSDLGACASMDTPQWHPAVRPALLRPLAAPDWSYLELAHIRDARQVQFQPDGTVRFRLFDEDLEKGVVLRGRLLATFVRRTQESELAPQIAREFAETPPNLSR